MTDSDDVWRTVAPRTATAGGSRGTRRVTLLGPVPPLRGGIAHHTDELSVALARSAAVQVLSYARLYPRRLFPGTSEQSPASSSSSQPASSQLPAEPVLITWRPDTWLRAARLIDRFAPDTLVAAYWHPVFAPQIAALFAQARARRRRTVLMVHNAHAHEGQALDEAAFALLAPLTTTAVVHAVADVAHLEPRGFARLAQAPHPPYTRFRPQRGRDATRAALGLAADDEVCLCFGLVRAYKGIDVALQAIARSGRPRTRLIIAGEPYLERRELLRWVQQAGGAQRVVLLDRYIPDDEVADLFAAADVVLAPYRHASHSGAVQIARANRVPVIAARVGGLPELLDVEAGDVLVPPDDPAALAVAIDGFFDAAPGRTARGGAGAGTAAAGGDGDGWDALARAVLDG